MSTEVTTEKAKAEFPRDQVIIDRAYILLQKEQAKQKSRGWSEYLQQATDEVDAWLKTVGEEATIEAWEAMQAAATEAEVKTPVVSEATPAAASPDPLAAHAPPRRARAPRATEAPEETATNPQA